MKIDLHIHSKSSDGAFAVEEIVSEAKRREIGLMAVTDHDNVTCQLVAKDLMAKADIRYVTGVELNVVFSHPNYRGGKPTSLDFLGYGFNAENKALVEKLEKMTQYREERAAKLLQNLNAEFQKEGIGPLTKADFDAIQATVDGTLGRPHIADYLIKKGIVRDRQEAFDKYLVKCDIPKYPLYLEEASKFVRDAGGRLVLAHPNDPHGTSLAVLTKSLTEQTSIVQESILSFIDGVECWHSRATPETANHYLKFAKQHGLIVTGGSDCHQNPVIMGSVNVPAFVAEQFT